ncbi:hypothetical protein BDF19DRAFT_440812 [Syncephalis fuscata]|nr:hypothetical protein BDF19DRAFT_440812 [Syncephalis fuscata]
MVALSNGSTQELNRLGEERAADLDRKLTAALADNDRLRTELLERDRVAPRDAELRRRATESAEEAANRIRELERLHAEARDQATKAREELAQATAASRDAVTRSLAADHATASKDTQLEELERQLEQHRRAADAAAQAVRSANARADESESLWQQTEERTSRLELELDEVRGELQSKTAELERQRKRTEDMERMWQSARNQITELKSVRDMFGDISSIKSTPPSSSRDMNNTTSHGEGGNDGHLEQQLRSQEANIEQLNDAIRRAEETRQDTERRAVQAEKLYAKAQSELAAFRRRSVFRHDQQANMSAELAAFESRIRAKQSECDEAQARASALLALMNDSPPRGMDADTHALVDRLIHLEREREQYESSMSSLRADLSRLQHERTGFI